MMYCIYVNDEIFMKKTPVVAKDITYPHGVIDRMISSYFHRELEIHDQREHRLTLGGAALEGKITLHYDGNKHTDNDVISTLGSEHLKILFDIVEHIYLSQGRTRDEVDNELNASLNTNAAYVNGSLKFPIGFADAKIEFLSTADLPVLVQMPDYYDFDILFPGKEQSTVRVYMSREVFLDHYPYSTILNIAFPCDPVYLLDPSKIEGVLAAIVGSAEHSLEDLHTTVMPEDSSGLLTYHTKFISKNSYGASIVTMLPFGVMYKGTEPSSLEIREAIRKDLMDLSIAPEAVWEAILPDVFVVAQFFMIPIWDNTYMRPQGILVPSVVNAYKPIDVIKELFPAFTNQYVQENQELLVCGQSEYFLTTIPDPLNKEEFSIQKKHPTYQIHMAQEGIGYLNMDVVTREFNVRLNQAMAVANGMESVSTIVTQEIDDLVWHSFTCAKTEYHLLSKSSYYKHFNISE